MRNWVVKGFDAKAWKAVKNTIAKKNFYTEYSDVFGQIMCGALCFDLVLRDYSDYDSGWGFSADAYLLGIDSGYGYTRDGTPYDEDDCVMLKYDTRKGFEETLKSFLEQIEHEVQKNKRWAEYADKTDLRWEEVK